MKKTIIWILLAVLAYQTTHAGAPEIEWKCDISKISDTIYKNVKINDFVEIKGEMLLAVGEAKLENDSVINVYAAKIDLITGSKIMDTLFKTDYTNSILKTGLTRDSILFTGVALKDTSILWITQGLEFKMENPDTIVVNPNFRPQIIGKFGDHILVSGNGNIYGKNINTGRIIDTTILPIQCMREVSSGAIHCSGIATGVTIEGGGSTNGLLQVIIDKEISNIGQYKFAHAVAPGSYLRPTHTTVLPDGTFICVGANDHYSSEFDTGVMHRNGAGRELSYKTYSVQNYDVGNFVTALNDSVLLIGGSAGAGSNSASGYVRKLIVDKNEVWTKIIPGARAINFIMATSDSCIIAFDGNNLFKLGKETSVKYRNNFDHKDLFEYHEGKKMITFTARNDMFLGAYSIDGKLIFSTKIQKGNKFRYNPSKKERNKLIIFQAVIKNEVYSIKYIAN